MIQKIYLSYWILIFMSANVLFVTVAGRTRDERLQNAANSKFILNETRYSNLCKSSVKGARFFDGNNCIKCSLLNSYCSAQQPCCPVKNGKSYCNVKKNRCEVIRYCDESSCNECPFNDLSPKEVAETITIIKRSHLFSSNIVFPIVRKQEPRKVEWNSGCAASKERIAYATVLDIERNILSEVLISLKRKRITSKKNLQNSVPLATSSESAEAQKIVLNDPRIINGYERRGLNMSYAALDLWVYRSNGQRLVKLVANYKDPETIYSHWRPVEGLETIVDLSSGKILDVIDEGNVAVPNSPLLCDDFIEDSREPLIAAKLDGLPQHSSITVNGFIINWNKWKFQYSIDPVHGLQLYHIRYLADCEERFLIYKLSISEMFVPYGESGKTWRWRGAIDAGEYGFGRSVSPIVSGRDVPDSAILLSCPKWDDVTGKVSVVENCVGLYERNAGLMYKHYDPSSNIDIGKTTSELAIVFSSAVGNYDYIFEYVFKESGDIDVHIYATGLLITRAISQVKNDPDCIEDCKDFINENQIGGTHQHFFNFRIDFDIEGTNNVLTELDFVNDPKSEENLDGGAFSLRRTIISRETCRDYSAKNKRSWSVINPQSRNKFNTPRGYSISSSNTPNPFLQGRPLSSVLFTTHPFWVTSYNDDEQGAAGDFPRSDEPGQGLPHYIRNQESIKNSDLVVWYTLGFTHGPRPEEYPIMNSEEVGFQISARNFQASNPMIPLKNQCHNVS